MKKNLILFMIMLLILALVTGCLGKFDDTPKTDVPGAAQQSGEKPGEETGEDSSSAGNLEGELCEAEGFTIIAPKGWDILKLSASDGYQLYRSGGEAIQVQFAGSNQKDDKAQRDAERFAENYEGTEPVEIEMLGKKFWTTEYEYGGQTQTFYARMEDGVQLSIQTIEGNYENNEEFKAILDSIVFK